MQNANVLPPHLQHLHHLQGDELKTAIQQEYFNQAMSFILRQTDYDEKTAYDRLCELKDPVKVVKEYLGAGAGAKSVSESDPPALKSKNQIKYGEIRKFMDTGARKYNMQKELNERRAKYQECVQQQQPEHPQQEQQEPNSNTPS